jgi:hypothetical protein
MEKVGNCLLTKVPMDTHSSQEKGKLSGRKELITEASSSKMSRVAEKKVGKRSGWIQESRNHVESDEPKKS